MGGGFPFPGGGPGGGFPGGGPGGGFPGGGPGGGFPGGGFPGGPGGPGFPGGPGGGQQGGGAPTSPPPSFVPQESQASAFAVDPGGIRRCMYRYTYVWLNNGSSFWFFPTFVGRNSVAGWRWRRRRGWVYFGIDLRQIRSFQCF
ncbi:transporter [Bacillus sp. JJ1122]